MVADWSSCISHAPSYWSSRWNDLSIGHGGCTGVHKPLRWTSAMPYQQACPRVRRTSGCLWEGSSISRIQPMACCYDMNRGCVQEAASWGIAQAPAGCQCPHCWNLFPSLPAHCSLICYSLKMAELWPSSWYLKYKNVKVRVEQRGQREKVIIGGPIDGDQWMPRKTRIKSCERRKEWIWSAAPQFYSTSTSTAHPGMRIADGPVTYKCVRVKQHYHMS